MREAVIHKPYFFPWMGYFAKLSRADVFIVQDNVLASNRVWINRAQIIRPDGQPGYITLPIGKKGDAIISTIELTREARQDSARRIAMSVEHAYSRSRYFPEWKVLKTQFIDIMASHSRLLEIDMAIIIALLKHLKIPSPEIHFASDLKCCPDDVDTLIANCRDTGCDTLILGAGHTDWKPEKAHRLQEAKVTPLTLDFYGMHPEYYQTRRQRLGFCRGLSILDCILNEGPVKTVALLEEVPYKFHKETLTHGHDI